MDIISARRIVLADQAQDIPLTICVVRYALVVRFVGMKCDDVFGAIRGLRSRTTRIAHVYENIRRLIGDVYIVIAAFQQRCTVLSAVEE